MKKARLELQANMMLRDMEYLTVDRPLEYLGRKYQLVPGRGRHGVKTGMSSKYLQSCAAVVSMETANPSAIYGRKVEDEWDLALQEEVDPQKVKVMQSGVGRLQCLKQEYPASSFSALSRSLSAMPAALSRVTRRRVRVSSC